MALYNMGIANALKQYFAQYETKVAFDSGTGVFSLYETILAPINELSMTIRVRGDSYTVQAPCPIRIDPRDEACILRVQEYLHRVNARLRLGCFFLSRATGVIDFRCTVLCCDLIPTEEMMDKSLEAPKIIYRQYGQGIIDVIYRGISPKEACDHCESLPLSGFGFQLSPDDPQLMEKISHAGEDDPFENTWEDKPDPDDLPDIAGAVERYLNDGAWFPRFDPESGIFVTDIMMKGPMPSLQYQIHISGDGFMVGCAAPLRANPADAVASRRIQAFLHLVNESLLLGCFEYSMDEGSIVFRYMVVCEGLTPSDDMIREALDAPASMYSRYGQGIIDALYRDAEPAAIYRWCETRTLSDLGFQIEGTELSYIPGGPDDGLPLPFPPSRDCDREQNAYVSRPDSPTVMLDFLEELRAHEAKAREDE